MRKERLNCSLKSTILYLVLLISTTITAQDILMQNGSFNACAPDRFLDSGGDTDNYSSNENFTITICPDNPGDVIVLDFSQFRTELNTDIMTIYDGDTTTQVIGNFSGLNSPGRVVSSDASGCLTVSFASNGFGNTSGWIADILCGQPCQTITATIDSTTPAINTTTNQIEILPGETVNFSGSAVFSDTDLNATYLWNFGTGATSNTLNTSHQFLNPGVYMVELTVTDNNPLGCSETVNVTVFVGDSIVTINNSVFPESFLLPAELIENVLVTGGCSAVDNFESQVFGGPADLQTKSYGYFTRGGVADFPFDSGIVISTGFAARGGNSQLPNDNGCCENNLGGDADLEAALGNGNSLDATFIKFNFTPTTDNISFRYLMASEEYDMVSECTFADGFAFLLREVGTTAYTNLAVLPDGTPVNVTNINNAPGCASNTPFFAGYNLGATNYGGRTEVLTASANVIANTTYEIKLVVADQSDRVFDTTIFIEAGSFNLGGDLGEDLTLAAGTAECGGQDVTLNTNAPNAAHTWFFNGVEIPGVTGSTYLISEAGTYSVDVEFAVGCTTSDSILVEFRNSPEIVAPPENLSTCSATGTASFNLTQNTPLVFGGQSTTEFSISYHNSQADADTGDTPITDPTDYAGTDGEVIFIRIADSATEVCVVTTSFTLSVFTSVTSEVITYQLCDNNLDGDDTNGFVEFDLSLINNQVLGTQSPTQFSVSYHLLPTDAQDNIDPLSNLYTNTTANSQIIYARVENNSNIDCFETSEITLQVDQVAIANPVEDQLICDDNSDGFWSFDLAALMPAVLGTQQSATDFEVTFHNTQAEADTDNAALTSPYSNQVAYQQESIFIRVENAINANCFATTSFSIDVFNQPTATTFTYELCDNADDGDDTNGLVEFNLPFINPQILGAQDPTLFTVSYHFDQANADAGSNPLLNLYTNTVANTDQIVARVQNVDNADCFDTATVILQVNALPAITDTVQLLQCDDDNDGLSTFNLTEANTLISTNAGVTFTYYATAANALSGAGEITNITDYPNTDASSNPDILFVRVETADSCFRVAQLNLIVSTTQIPAGFEVLFEECDTADIDNDITNGITTFDFSSAEAQIRTAASFPAGQNLTFSYYQNEADALSETNQIIDITNYRNDASPFEQEIYVRVDSDVDNSCLGLGVHIRLRTTNPNPNPNPDNLILCDDVTIGDLQESFDLTQNEIDIFNGATNLIATYYLSSANALSGTGAIPIPTAYTNTNSTETIFVRVEGATGCFAIVDFDITVNPLPTTFPIEPLEACENATDGVFDFDLSTKTNEILNGQDPTLFTVSFYENQIDADNLTNPLPNLYTNTSNPQQLFVAITNTSTGCSNSSESFIIEVIEGAQANSDGQPLDFELCDDNIMNDGVAQFDLTTIEDEILDGQNPADVTITYHISMDDALNGVNLLPSLYENLTNPQTIYTRVSNNLSPDICFEVQPIPLRVNPIPVFDLDDVYVICTDTNGSEVVPIPPVLDTGLSTTDYSFEWSLNGTVLSTETTSSLVPTQPGSYSVIVSDITTSTITRCMSMDSADVIESSPPIVTAQVTSQAFAGNHTVEAIAEGSSIYEYNLDNGPWQETGSFENVRPGVRTISARDINGCGVSSITILVIDYPLFFTPNGDGDNDTWNIVGIDTQPNAKIYIFDRYGKLLKQLSPTSLGWDGTFQGNLLPTDDYWFSIEYTEPLTGETKQQRAHFTLKR